MKERRTRIWKTFDADRAHAHRLKTLIAANERLGAQKGAANQNASAGSEAGGTQQLIFATRTPPAKKPGGARSGAKMTKRLERISDSGPLCPEQATGYRALSARGNYLAQDRIDISYSSKELCKEFSVPTDRSHMKLKRLGRYLVGNPRLVYEYRWQTLPTDIDVYVDTDFAGCKETSLH